MYKTHISDKGASKKRRHRKTSAACGQTHVSQISGDVSTIDDLYLLVSGEKTSGVGKTDNPSYAQTVLNGILSKHDGAKYFAPTTGIYTHKGNSNGLKDGQQVKGVFITTSDGTKGASQLWFMKEDGAVKIYNAPASQFTLEQTSNCIGDDGTDNGVYPLNVPCADNIGTTTTQTTTPTTTQTDTSDDSWLLDFGGYTPSATTTSASSSSGFWSTLGTDFQTALPGMLNSASSTVLGTPVSTGAHPVAVTTTSTSSSGKGVVIGLFAGAAIGGTLGGVLMKNNRIIGVIGGIVAGGVIGLIIGKVA